MKYTLGLTLFPALALAACSSGPSDQILSGRVQQGSFSSPITQVRAYHGTTRVAETAVAADGSFSLAVAPGTGVRLELASANPARVVFPRSSGAIDLAFTIRGGGAAFDLGNVRFVGASTGHKFTFVKDSTQAGDCHDGQDSTGAICVEDQDENHGTCSGDSGDSGGDQAGGDSGGDGSGAGDTGGSGDDETDSAAGQANPNFIAVADHNFPQDGCNAEDSGDSGGGDTGGGDTGGDTDGGPGA